MAIDARPGLRSATTRLRRRAPLSPSARIWVLNVFLGISALLAAAICAATFGSHYPNWQLPWWLIALLFYGAEARVVHLHFRRGAHSFSLSEVPLVIGLLLAAPSALIIGNFVGVALALRFARHQPPVKLVFNAATMVLSTTLAITTFKLVVGLAAAVGDAPASWLGAFAAVVVSNLFGVVAVGLAITLSEGHPGARKVRQMLTISSTVAVTNASIALLAVTVVLADTRAVWLLALPVVTLYAGYRAYIGERQQLESLELLYQSSRIIQRTPELDSALIALLRHSREMFRAERAEIVLYPNASGDEFLRTAVGPDERMVTMEPVDAGSVASIEAILGREPQAFLFGTTAEEVAYDVEDGQVRDAIVAPLTANGVTVGFMIVVNRMGDISTFRPEDLKLFETVANHAGTALENGQLERSLAQLSSLKDELRHQAYHDALTNLANRHLFAETVTTRLKDPPRGDVVSVLFVDLDDFKLVNDTYGHAVGDALLAEAASRITGCIREGDVAARLGGDEFGLLLIDTPRLDRSQRIARRIIDQLHRPFTIGGVDLSISASIGIATPDGLETTDTLLRHADVAMYDAKAGGKGRWAIFEPKMQLALAARQDISAELARALNHREFELLFQPVVSLDDGTIQGAEALLRWNHQRRGVVGPKDFIGVAEESNLIVPLGRWALGEACRQAQSWATGASDDPWVSVNISARQILHPSFTDDVARAIDSSGIAPGRLVLEVTESVLLQDGLAAARKLEAVRALGARVALDDFGTGYSSLSYLQRFPIDMLKIAQEFVPVDGVSHGDWALAHAIISLGRTLELGVVAEGVERREQVVQLKRLGCTLAQGYHFAAPLNAADIAGELSRSQHRLRGGHTGQRLRVVDSVA